MGPNVVLQNNIGHQSKYRYVQNSASKFCIYQLFAPNKTSRMQILVPMKIYGFGILTILIGILRMDILKYAQGKSIPDKTCMSVLAGSFTC